MVVGRGDRHHRTHAQGGQAAPVGRLILGREAERTHPDDGALPRHEPGHRLHRAQGARVGQGHRHAAEVVGRHLLGVDLAHQILVGHHEGPEIETLGMADDGDEQRPRAVALAHVDGQAETDVLVPNHPGGALLVDLVDEGGVEGGHGLQGLHHGVADEMGEADLGARRPGQVLVQYGPVDLEQLGRHRPDAGGRRNGQRRLHVDHDPGRRPPEGHRRRIVALAGPERPTGRMRRAGAAAGVAVGDDRSGRRCVDHGGAAGAGAGPPSAAGAPLADRELRWWPAGPRWPRPARRCPVGGTDRRERERAHPAVSSRRRTRRQLSLTEEGSLRYSSYMSSTSQAFGPKAPPDGAPGARRCWSTITDEPTGTHPANRAHPGTLLRAMPTFAPGPALPTPRAGGRAAPTRSAPGPDRRRSRR